MELGAPLRAAGQEADDRLADRERPLVVLEAEQPREGRRFLFAAPEGMLEDRYRRRMTP